MLGIKKFYYTTLHKDELKLTKNPLNHGPLPILWMNKGLYGLITREKVKNVIQYLENQHKLKPMSPYPIFYTFHWDEVIIVQPTIGEQLFGKKSD